MASEQEGQAHPDRTGVSTGPNERTASAGVPLPTDEPSSGTSEKPEAVGLSDAVLDRDQAARTREGGLGTASIGTPAGRCGDGDVTGYRTGLSGDPHAAAARQPAPGEIDPARAANNLRSTLGGTSGEGPVVSAEEGQVAPSAPPC